MNANLEKVVRADPLTKLNGFERLIAKVSPTAALRRHFARTQLKESVRSYESIELSRLRRQRQDARSPDQIGSISVDKLRLNTRYLDENHDIARSALNTLVAHIVGTGLLTFPTVKNKAGDLLDDVNNEITKLWSDWSRTPEVTQEYDWPRAQALACRSWLRDGETFAQLLRGHIPALDHGTEVLFSIEQLESDFCPLNLNDSERNVRQGVEKNTWRRPRGYFFFKEYPTETGTSGVLNGILQGTSFSTGFKDVKRVDAQNVAHLKHADRINQTRGVSIFSSVFTRLDDLKDYEESERVAARIGAAFAFAITKSIDAPGVDPADTSSFREMDLAPGIIADALKPGEKIESLKNERPDNKITEFRANQLKAVAGGAGVGYSSFAKDFDGSYSSQRQELVEQNKIYQVLRKEFVASYVNKIYKAFVEVAVVQGLIDVAGVDPLTLYDADHVGLGTPYIEPKRETDSDIELVKAGFKSKAQVILGRGDNPREVSRQIERERESDNEKELIFSSDYAHDVVADSDAAGGGADVAGGNNPDGGDKDDVNEDPEDNADAEDDERSYVIGKRYEGPGGFYKYTANGMVKVA